jgi:anti-sigma B factor antagonist
MSELRIEQRQVGPVTILDLSGNITIGSGGKSLDATIEWLVEEGRIQILLNLAKVVYVDSCGLGNMVSGYNRVRNRGGQIKVLNLTERVRDLMTITKLATVFDIYGEESAALNSYR